MFIISAFELPRSRSLENLNGIQPTRKSCYIIDIQQVEIPTFQNTTALKTYPYVLSAISISTQLNKAE
jgi:hypothetical protein